ncbi:MAG: nucleotidyltransferase family protein [Pirellulales bacterium]
MSTVVESREVVIDRIRILEPELRKLGVKRIALFGSFVAGRQNEESDVDLLIEFMPGQKTFEHFDVVYDLLENAVGRKVELVTVDSLSPFIGPKILREALDVFVSA